MFQDIFPHVYHNEFSKQAQRAADHILAFSGRGLLCRVEDGALLLPTQADLDRDCSKAQYLFTIDETAYFLHEGPEPQLPAPWDWAQTRGLRSCRPDEHLFAMAAGESLWRWYGSNRFCGCCGAGMLPGETERSLVCSACGHTVYPKICPAVIAAVHDGDRLVLTRYRGRPFRQYALVAGFNEIGESIEDTVRREVLEEVGLHVGELRFYKSQPWTFTDSLLMGFFARLDGSDEITVQESELSEARWFSREEIPQDHSAISLTGEMIEVFRRGEIV